MLDSNRPTGISRLLRRGEDPPTEGRSPIQRMLGRARNAWENGSLWVALVIGLVLGPSPDTALFVVAVIVTSGAAIGAQISAAIVFIVGVLAPVEITLASYLVTPAKTQAVLLVLHDWARVHRQKIVVAVMAVVGVVLLAYGTGTVGAGA